MGLDMYSDLENLVMYDMYCNGFEPTKKDDIIAYWAALLD
jgi:hypothetical protein